MSKHMKLIFGLSIVLALFISANGQEKHYDSQDDFIVKVIRSLPANNMLRVALERGEKGDGIHHSWMDEMKKYEIKQAAYVFNFEWQENKIINLIEKRVSYHPAYYQYDVTFKDERKIQEIKESDLAEILKAEAMIRARNLLEKVLKRESPNESARGTVYSNLLDDERLPILVDLPEWELLKNKE